MSDERIVCGQAATYADAHAMVQIAGYKIAPEYAGYYIVNPDGLDAYGIPVIV